MNGLGLTTRKRAINLEGVGFDRYFQPLANHHLENIAGPNVLDTLAHGIFERRLLEIRREADVRVAPGIDIRRGQIEPGRRELGHDRVHITLSFFVGCIGWLAFFDPRHHDHGHDLVHVVENNHAIVECETHVGQLAVVRRCIRQTLGVSDHIVTRVTDSASDEWGQVTIGQVGGV